MFSNCECLSSGHFGERFNRNTIASIVAGAFFAFGWWILIDSICQYPTADNFNKAFCIVGVVGTLALILINSVSNSQVRGESLSEGCLGQVGARIILFISFLMAFGSLIGGAWILFFYYIPKKSDTLYPGIAIFCQNLAIFLSALIMKFGRKEELDY